jgi:hypothetical protein
VGRKTNKQQRQKQAVTAREKAAIARAAQQRAEQRRRATVVLSSVGVIVVVGAVIAFFALHSTSKAAAGVVNNRSSAPASIDTEVSSVPVSTLNTVGQGSIASSGLPAKVTGTPLTASGKPELLFIGAEFCPYCAAERWSMAVALSRFGTLNGVRLTASSSTDVDPNTATLDFVKSTYTSKYLSFVAVENLDRDRKPLTSTTAAQNAIWLKYDNNQESFPFLDFGNKYSITSPSFDPGILKGLSQATIAADLKDPTTKVAKAIDGAANLITASICGITNNAPTAVCSSATIKGLQSKINA